ncbi:MAG TPA: hypothetical protein VGP41_14325 [Candidatus Lustribacter sp.]|jgi:hypothetical protein|nr:hypothetical protein [Candidatus Lustribacter sp.]
MNALLARTLILTTAVLATSAGANADPVQVGLSLPPAAGPIQVNRVTMPHNTINEFNMLPQNIAISFTNESTKPATDVVFGMLDRQNSTIHEYDERGTFAPGVEIVRQVPWDRIMDHQLGAEVLEVTFADGSVWEKPAPAAPVSRRQATY